MTETTGSIINIVNTGQVITLTVKYIVDHHVYSFKEEAVLKPARQLLLFKSKRKVPVLGTLRVGQKSLSIMMKNIQVLLILKIMRDRMFISF